MSSDACRFCEIVRGETTAYTVFADEFAVAFLDRRPLFPGHLLLIPREHIATLPELPERLIGPLFGNAQLLTRAVVMAMGADGTFVAVNNGVSQSVPHLHIHIVPRRRHDGLKGFFWPRQPYSSEEAAREAQTAIQSAISRLLLSKEA